MAKPKSDAERRQEADAILRRVELDSERIGRSNTSKRLEKQLLGTTDQSDPVERLGRLLGRGLGFLFLLYLAWHLFTTYIAA